MSLLADLTVYTYDGRDQAILSGVVVKLEDRGTGDVIERTSNASGECYFTLMPSQYSLTATKDGFYIYRESIGVGLGTYEEHIVMAYKPLVPPWPDYDLYVHVRDDDNNPISGAWVQIRTAAWGPFQTLTDANGTATFLELPEIGTWYYQGWKEGYGMSTEESLLIGDTDQTIFGVDLYLEPLNYPVKVLASGPGDVSASPSIDTNGFVQVPQGSSMSAVATADFEAVFDKWTLRRLLTLIDESTDPNYTFTPDNYDYVLTAYFSPWPEVTVQSGIHGQTVPAAGTTLVWEPEATFNAEAFPDSGYEFNRWSILSGVKPSDWDRNANPIAFTVDGDITIKAVYTSEAPVPTYNLTVLSEGGGYTDYDGVSEFEAGEIVMVTAYPNVGYRLHHWVKNGTIISDVGGTYLTVTMNQNIILMASFELIPPDEDENGDGPPPEEEFPVEMWVSLATGSLLLILYATKG